MKRLLLLAAVLLANFGGSAEGSQRPNILLAISDDQSWLHTSSAGCKAIKTPAFDRVAQLGVLFNNCIAGSPGCSPSRAALLTGLHHWQLREAGTHASSFSTNFLTYPDLLESHGYFIGCTGKGWGPGNFAVSGRTRNPAGPAFNTKKLTPPREGLSANNYAANFADFLARCPKDKPFCFWFGATEPHRDYEQGSGVRAGKRLSDVVVPPFLPDTPEVRSDLLDYLLEIEWFDQHLARMLELLEKQGELTNTLVIVTGDNGMPFPRAKANMYEYGIHVPLAIGWPNHFPSHRTVEDVVGFVDLTATILEAAGVEHPGKRNPEWAPTGRSLLNLLTSSKAGVVEPSREMVFSGRERHSSSRYNNLGYPARALRTRQYLYIRNFAPELWPAGDPQALTKSGKPGPRHGGYHDIDDGPTIDLLRKNADDPKLGPFLQLAVAKHPAEELFDIVADPACLKNLANDSKYASELKRLREAMERTLRETGDPRMGQNPNVWESYKRYSPIRDFPPPRQ